MEYYSFISSFQRPCYEYSALDDNNENPRCSAIPGLWYGTIGIQMNQSEHGYSTTHNLVRCDRSSSTCTEWRRKSVFGNRTVNQFWTLKSVRWDMTTYSFLALKFQMAEDEGKETKFSEPSRMTINAEENLVLWGQKLLKGSAMTFVRLAKYLDVFQLSLLLLLQICQVLLLLSKWGKGLGYGCKTDSIPNNPRDSAEASYSEQHNVLCVSIHTCRKSH